MSQRTSAILPNPRGHLNRVIEDLLAVGWKVESIPEDGAIPRNGMKLLLRTGDFERRVRIFAYKVTSSGRSRPHERRVEITTTYRSGLRRSASFRDVVLGVDTISNRYVGIDSRRLRLGGVTHNASSFFDREGLSVERGQLLINPRAVVSTSFSNGIELHAFFDRSRLSEYLFSQSEIHSGLYAFGGEFGGSVPEKRGARSALRKQHVAAGEAFVLYLRPKETNTKVRPSLITAVEEGDTSKLARAGLTPEQLRRILKICEEIGALGEQAVLVAERSRLRRLGYPKQAEKVERVSLKSVSHGYDILSFEDDGSTKRYLEVKATNGSGSVVDISRGEWRAAAKHASQYYLVRVTNARVAPTLFYIRNPAKLERDGQIVRTPTGWQVDLRLAM